MQSRSLPSSHTCSAFLAKQFRPALAVLHHDESDDSCDPVEDVSEDGADRGTVRPAEDGVEDLPSVRVEVALGVAAVQVPDVTANIVGTGSISGRSSIVNIRTKPE